MFSVSHEKEKHPGSKYDEPQPVPEDKENAKEDFKYNYHKGKLSYGLLLFDINDAIKEGDGIRLLNLYKIALYVFKCYGRTKYAYTTLLFLVKS